MLGLRSPAVLVALLAAALATPATSAQAGGPANSTDWCNGVVEDDGCVHRGSDGTVRYCLYWVAGVCVEGGAFDRFFHLANPVP